MANIATVTDIENKIRELCKLPPAQPNAQTAHVHKQSPRDDPQSQTVDNQLNRSTDGIVEGKGKKMKKRKGSQNQPAEVTSIADKESSNVHVNVTEQKTGEVLQRESQRPRPRSSQQRGKGGGRNVGPPNGPQTGYKQDESPADMKPFDKVLQEKFESDGMFPLKKKSVRFPNARYYCRLCSFHCMSDEHCEKHMLDTRHMRLKAIKSNDIMLNNLPSPTAAHVAAVTALLQKVVAEQVLSTDGLTQRMNVQATIRDIAKLHFPDLVLTLYGSTVSGFALKDSDVNMTITEYESPMVLRSLFDVLKADESGSFDDVTSDFNAEMPYMVCHSAASQVTCRINLATVAACKTSQLLALYAAVDPRVVQLTIAFRYWAKLCHVDRRHEGALPSFAFTVMTIYFLQQCQPPVLPVLHELVQPTTNSEEEDTDSDVYFIDIDNLGAVWQCRNSSSIGELWIRMLQFYALTFNNEMTVVSIRQRAPMTREEKRWGRHKLALQDPFLPKRNIARTLSSIQMYEYICDRLRATYGYFGIARTSDGPLYTEIEQSFIASQLRDNLKKLAEEMVSGGDKKTTDALTQNGVPSRTADKYVVDSVAAVGLKTGSVADSSPPIEIKDLGSGECRLDDDVDKGRSFRLNTTGAGDTPACSAPPINTSGKPADPVHTQAGSIATSVISDVVLDFRVNVAIKQLCTDNLGNVVAPSRFPVDHPATDFLGNLNVDGVSTEDVTVRIDEPPVVSDNIRPAKVVREFRVPLGKNGKPVDLEEIERLTQDQFGFLFSADTLYDGKGPALVCSSCKKEGHLDDNCPDDLLPPIKPLPSLTPRHYEMLEEVLIRVQYDFSPSQHEMDVRNRAIKELQSYIQQSIPTAHLNLFGSSCNGFGFRSSDMDICMTLAETTADGLECAVVMEKLTNTLKRNRDLYNIISIPTAKVPIVKFRHRPAQLDGDISLYNTLAQQNTRMLRMYSTMDARVTTLGYAMKVLAKVCDIGDASRGSLSSYAYVLMVLYYLQHTDPPVLPVLQELYSGKKPEKIIDGCNAWFYDDMSTLKDVWPGIGQNKQSIAELWIGLLRFYTEQFNFREFVISVGQKETLTRFEKLWNGKCLAIEDPFNHSHNLGGALSRRMNAFILKALIKSRSIFGSPFKHQPQYPSLAEQLFNPELLTDGSPPNDKGCRICGKIGHFSKECPRSRRNKQAGQHRETNDRGSGVRKQGIDQHLPVNALIPGVMQQQLGQQQQQQRQQQQRQHQQRPPQQRQQQQRQQQGMNRPMPVHPGNRHPQPLQANPQQGGVPRGAQPQQYQPQQQPYQQRQPVMPPRFWHQQQYRQRQPHNPQQALQQALQCNAQPRGPHTVMGQHVRQAWHDPHPHK